MGAKTLPEKEDQQQNKRDDQQDDHSHHHANKRMTKKKRERIRAFPIWLRIVVVFILAIITLMVGLVFGYSVIGDGSVIDAFKLETWRHMVHIISKE